MWLLIVTIAFVVPLTSEALNIGEIFPIYWNVPSFMCQRYGINFSEHTKRYGIIANENDSFRGDKVNILYDPGAFPAVLKSSKGRIVERNGGIPQLGNITYHLEALNNVINQVIPENYTGIGIIDFEAWRPIYRQNYGDQTTYTNMSKELVRQKHPQWDENRVTAEAVRQFERSSKVFIESSLKLAKTLRPKARWGYYGYPYCYNYRKNTGMKPYCSQQVQRENNQIQWLFDASDALFPSLYMGKTPSVDARGYVNGRMNEAVRVASRKYPDHAPEINPYMWYRYFDSLDFLSESDLYHTMESVRRYKAGGYVIWGSSNDFRTKEKCQAFLSYFTKVIGPTIEKVRARYPSDDEQIDFVAVNGDRFALGYSNQTHEFPNEISAEPTYEASPNVVIYSAIAQNGTSKTVFKYDPAPVVSNTMFKYDAPPVPTTTSTPKTSAKREFSDVPLLREYVRGFENILDAIVKRWTKAVKKK